MWGCLLVANISFAARGMVVPNGLDPAANFSNPVSGCDALLSKISHRFITLQYLRVSNQQFVNIALHLQPFVQS